MFYIELIRGIPILIFLFYVAFVGAPWLVAAANFVDHAADRRRAGSSRSPSATSISPGARSSRSRSATRPSSPRSSGPASRRSTAGRSRRRERWASSRGTRSAIVVAPQALRTILPPLGNDFISMIKDSALVSALGVQDITQVGKVYAAGNFRFFETYTRRRVPLSDADDFAVAAGADAGAADGEGAPIERLRVRCHLSRARDTPHDFATMAPIMKGRSMLKQFCRGCRSGGYACDPCGVRPAE